MICSCFLSLYLGKARRTIRTGYFYTLVSLSNLKSLPHFPQWFGLLEETNTTQNSRIWKTLCWNYNSLSCCQFKWNHKYIDILSTNYTVSICFNSAAFQNQMPSLTLILAFCFPGGVVLFLLKVIENLLVFLYTCL